MKKILFALMISFTLNGCAVVEPWVRQFNIVSVPQEIQIGEQAAREVSKQMVLVQDSSVTGKVSRLGNRLAAALPRKDYNYQFYVIKDPSPNAFTIPGGKIYVHTGLLNFAQNEEELAGVMAHEIGHAYQRHPAKSISRQYGVETLSQLLFARNQAAQSQMKSIALGIAKAGIITRYGRQDEFEADEAGFYILRRAGFKSDGLIKFFQRLQTLQGRGGSIPFLSSHPPTPERIARLQQLESGARQPTLVFQTPQAG